MSQRELESSSSSSSSSGIESSFRRRFMDAARPDVYAANAFRITGLPVHATAREVLRQADRMEIAARIGGAPPAAAAPFPLASTPDRDVIRDAIDRLRDPERRLIEELFWFWPHDPDDTKTDFALRLLAGGDTEGAIRLWNSVLLSGGDRGAARHNLAVCAHLRALESGSNGDGERLWREAFEHWKALLSDDPFWSRLAARITQLDDPRLTTGVARRLRRELPAALVSISAALAMRAAETNDMATLRRHATLLRNAGFDPKIVREALRNMIAPVRQRLRTRCAAVQSEAKANPRVADKVVTKAFAELTSILGVFNAFFEVGDLTRDGAHDEVALALLDAVEEFAGETEAWLRAAALCQPLLPVAAREPARKQITEAIEKLKRNATVGRDWVTAGYYELPAPVLDLLQQARKKAREVQLDAAMELIAGHISRTRDVHPAVLAPLAWCLSIKAMREFESFSARLESMPAAQSSFLMMRIAQMLVLAHELLPSDPRYREEFQELKEVFDRAHMQYPTSAELRRSLGIAFVPIPTVYIAPPPAKPPAAGTGCLVGLAAMLALFVLGFTLLRIHRHPANFISERRTTCLAAPSISGSTSAPRTAALPVSKALTSASFATTTTRRPHPRPSMSIARMRYASAARPRTVSRTTATTPFANSNRRWAPTARRSSSAPAAG